MSDDPTITDPDKYVAVYENERVRVLEYRDTPGAKTNRHRHPDSVVCAVTSFRRKVHTDAGVRDVALEAGQVMWLPAQEHVGENCGLTDTHVILVELKS